MTSEATEYERIEEDVKNSSNETVKEGETDQIVVSCPDIVVSCPDPSSSSSHPEDAPTTVAPPAPQTKKLSKNQQKKLRKLERRMEIKKQKKQQRKEVRMAKAKAQGRDLEAERRFVQERTRSGEGKKRRQEKWNEIKLPLVNKSFQVCLDCSFEEFMTPKEINSLALQIRYCYASNRRSPHPCRLVVTSLANKTLDPLKKVEGFDEWRHRAFTCTGEPFETYFSADLSKVVYLTSDSQHTLQDLDDSKIYIIGGIVDRNRLKQAAYERAKTIGVATAKLPLDEHLQKMEATRVLTCNHVFDILLKYREHGRDWKKALMEVLPHRKDAQIDDESSVDETKKIAVEPLDDKDEKQLANANSVDDTELNS